LTGRDRTLAALPFDGFRPVSTRGQRFLLPDPWGMRGTRLSSSTDRRTTDPMPHTSIHLPGAGPAFQVTRSRDRDCGPINRHQRTAATVRCERGFEDGPAPPKRRQIPNELRPSKGTLFSASTPQTRGSVRAGLGVPRFEGDLTTGDIIVDHCHIPRGSNNTKTATLMGQRVVTCRQQERRENRNDLRS